MLRINKNASVAEKAYILLALMLNWNVLVGICDQLALLSGISLFSLVSQYSVVFSALFLGCTIIFVFLHGQLQTGIIVLLIWFPLMILSFIIDPEIRLLFPRATVYFVNNVFCIAVLFSYVSDTKALIKLLKKYVLLSVVYSVLFFLSNLMALTDGIYDMSFSYATLISAVLSLLIALRGRGKARLFIIPFFIIFLVNFKCGSRGSLLCYLLVLIINFYFSDREAKKKQAVLIIFAALFLVIGWTGLINLLTVLFPESRNVRLLATGQALYPASRQIYYKSIIEELLKHPLRIRGLYSDRFFLASEPEVLENVWGAYSHNIILEILFQFGIWGIIPVAAFVFCLGKILVQAKRTCNGETIVLTEIVVTCGLGQLLLSSSYLISPFFGALWGMMLLLRAQESTQITADNKSITEASHA